jgi:hypothetical protein
MAGAPAMKRRKMIVLGAAVLVMGLMVGYLAGPAEPRYKGYTLTEYLEGHWVQMDRGFGTNDPDPHFAPDKQAVLAIGTNGIPTLLRLSRTVDPTWKVNLVSWLKGHKLMRATYRDAQTKRNLGFVGFYLLGEEAAPATSALVRLTQDPSPVLREHGLQCLMQIHPTKELVLPILVRQLHDSDQMVREGAAYSLNLSFPDEAAKAGVYKMFPEFDPWATNGMSTNSSDTKQAR